ncbi:MAG: redox-regulated ATPase YchF [Candidatus Omnitrophica bacterium]|nr:redox-regulated ATPase YchF [Candidatus Omnitrophota bacterium]
MALSIGIVGLPNVGKSTLFNAITNAGAEVQNYPFCTIDPNTGIVPIHDSRLPVLAKMSKSKEIIYSTMEFVDIAGLVKGASKGEGLGNKFLANIREVSAIAHVVRCFKDENVTHVSGTVDPESDIETINLELILADLESAEKILANTQKKAKCGDKEQIAHCALLKKITDTLGQNKPVRELVLNEEEKVLIKTYSFLTNKKVIYVANVGEDMIGSSNEDTKKVKKIADSHGDEFAVISAKIEEELSALSEDERAEYLKDLGIECSGLDLIARKCFDLLGLQTYLTTGEKETRAWTIKKGDTAPIAAGVIHTDFERGFIRANIVGYGDFVANNGWLGAKEKGLLRQEGKSYIMKDGDIVEFLFNV